MKPTIGLVTGEVTLRDADGKVDSGDIFDASAGIGDASAEVPNNRPADFSRVRRVRSCAPNLDEAILNCALLASCSNGRAT